MKALKKDLEKMKYDSFLNGLEEAFANHQKGDKSDEQLVNFAKDLIERFVALYGDDQDTELRLETKKIVLGYIMNLN